MRHFDAIMRSLVYLYSNRSTLNIQKTPTNYANIQFVKFFDAVKHDRVLNDPQNIYYKDNILK